MTRKGRRLVVLLSALLALGAATAMVLAAFNDNLVFFYTPSELQAKGGAAGHFVRIGGLVERGSLSRDGERSSFRVTDGRSDVTVAYTGMLPDLFREGQGVVVEGRLRPDGSFAAATVLAKHDERYMPRDVVEALKKSGRWQENSAAAAPPGMR
jgi:cytochrome c-type biogenesis protein CcmE